MTKSTKADLKKRALMAVRDYGVNLTQFRNAMSEWAGLNVTDMECLRLLFQKGIATPTELARHTGLTSGATTAMLDRLEKAGLIERRPNPDDRLVRHDYTRTDMSPEIRTPALRANCVPWRDPWICV